MERILTDLARLHDIPHRHLRSKLAIYCCNGRLSYFKRLANLQTSLPEAQLFDQAMAAFFRQTLRFPPPGQYGMHSATCQPCSSSSLPVPAVQLFSPVRVIACASRAAPSHRCASRAAPSHRCASFLAVPTEHSGHCQCQPWSP